MLIIIQMEIIIELQKIQKLVLDAAGRF